MRHNPLHDVYSSKLFDNDVAKQVNIYSNPTYDEIIALLSKDNCIRGLYGLNSKLFIVWNGESALHVQVAKYLNIGACIMFDFTYSDADGFYLALTYANDTVMNEKAIKTSFKATSYGKLLYSMANEVYIQD